jgi:hypothetical protein
MSEPKFQPLDSEALRLGPEYGRYWMFLHTQKHGHLLAVGPQWYFSLIVLSIILGVSIFVYHYFGPMVSVVIRSLFLIVLVFTCVMYLLAILTNPGVIPRRRPTDEEIQGALGSQGEIACQICHSLRSQRARHCADCDACIEGYDHHCVFMGKCVGRRNFSLFSVFAISVPALFFSILILSCMATNKQRGVIF